MQETITIPSSLEGFINTESKFVETLIGREMLLIAADLVKTKLEDAYTMTNEVEMTNAIDEIMEICEDTKNEHFLWFHRLFANHFEGIIAHATYKISSGKREGTNNMIKTVRRQAYGYPDDDYFFLKLFDASRKKSRLQNQSHYFSD